MELFVFGAFAGCSVAVVVVASVGISLSSFPVDDSLLLLVGSFLVLFFYYNRSSTSLYVSTTTAAIEAALSSVSK